MSTGPKIPLAQAKILAEKLCRELALPLDPPGDYLVAGSIRRGMPMVGDIDICCPLPAPASAGAGKGDRLQRSIEQLFTRVQPGMLFTPPLGMGRIEKGVKPGFKFCSLVIHAKLAGLAAGVETEVPVQIHRYVPGPLGNRGWVELERTGPAEFGKMFLWHWKRARGCPAEASREGFLLDHCNGAVPTPTEEMCFEMAGLKYVAPQDRMGAESVRRAG